MNQDPYQSIKKGIKEDVKNTAMGFYLIGGLSLLFIVLLAGLMTALTSKHINDSTRVWTIIGVVGIASILIFSKNARTRILQGWLILLVAIPICFILFLIAYFMYQMVANPV
jgi:hypothetical protein